MLVMVNYHWFSSDFVTWSCWLWLIIIDFPQIMLLGYVGYGKLSLISLRICHVVMLAMGNYHWFPSDFVKWSCWLREIITDFPQNGDVVMLVMGNYHWFPLDFVTWLLISLRLCHLVKLGMVNYHWFASDFVKWSCWLREIIIDFPQTLSLGHVEYGKLSLIFLGHFHLVMLVMVNYHWFPSDFVTWSCWLWEIIIDFHQNLSSGHVG